MGQAILTLANNGHSLRDLEGYSWAQICGLLDNLAESRNPKERPQRESRSRRNTSSDEITVEMDRAEYLKRMGVTDPALAKKLNL